MYGYRVRKQGQTVKVLFAICSSGQESSPPEEVATAATMGKKARSQTVSFALGHNSRAL